MLLWKKCSTCTKLGTTIHLFISFTSFPLPVMGDGVYPQQSLCERQEKPWTGCKSITIGVISIHSGKLEVVHRVMTGECFHFLILDLDSGIIHISEPVAWCCSSEGVQGFLFHFLHVEVHHNRWHCISHGTWHMRCFYASVYKNVIKPEISSGKTEDLQGTYLVWSDIGPVV